MVYSEFHQGYKNRRISRDEQRQGEALHLAALLARELDRPAAFRTKFDDCVTDSVLRNLADLRSSPLCKAHPQGIIWAQDHVHEMVVGKTRNLQSNSFDIAEQSKMDSVSIFNALVLPLFATWFIPNSIRDIKTGKYLGINNDKARLCILLVFLLESWTILQKFDPGLLTAVRIVFSAALPVAGAYVFVKLTHKKLFGKPIMFTKWW